jgi:hypothetical protein
VRCRFRFLSSYVTFLIRHLIPDLTVVSAIVIQLIMRSVPLAHRVGCGVFKQQFNFLKQVRNMVFHYYIHFSVCRHLRQSSECLQHFCCLSVTHLLPISPVILIPHIIPLSYRSNTTAERAGSVSCYPAAFADLPADRSIITIVVDACPRYVQMICITSSPRTKPHDICDINFYFHSLCFQSSGALIG